MHIVQAVVSFDLEIRKTFKPGQMHVALSQIRHLQEHFLTGSFCKEAIKACAGECHKYDQLLDTAAFISAPVDNPPYNTLFFTLVNTRSLKMHDSEIASDSCLLKVFMYFVSHRERVMSSQCHY